jgi:hypothetical protein
VRTHRSSRSPSEPFHPWPRARLLGAVGGPLLLVALALGGGLAGCSGSHDATSADMAPMSSMAPATPARPAEGGPSPAGGAAVPPGSMTMPTGTEVAAAWAARPAYVTALPAAGQAAYAFALERPDVLQWLPCYCGCVAMDHRSNSDCFFQRRDVPGTFTYEEHASYCDVCIRTANLASTMLTDGSSIAQIRAAVDVEFGNLAPGTDTPLPPA